MYFCQVCGIFLELVQRGGCGGNGAIYGCPNCDALFRQTTGGIVSTPGGETLSPIPGSYKEMKWGKEKQLEVARVKNLKEEMIDCLGDNEHVADNFGILYAYLKQKIKTVKWYMEKSGYPLSRKKK